MANLSPVKLSPAFKDYLWGGTKLKEQYNKKSDLEIVAESWEMSCHKDGQSTVATGEFGGKTLSEYVEALGKAAQDNQAFSQSPYRTHRLPYPWQWRWCTLLPSHRTIST